MDKITLDREAFKALASDTRLDLLKALDVRQKTVTELARELDLNKATVFEHLEKLNTVGLVEKIEDDRKWVYYQLTWKGRRLLHPEKITIALLLSSGAASLLTGVTALWLWWSAGQTQGDMARSGDDMQAESAPQAADALAAPATTPPPEAAGQDPALLAVALILMAMFVGLLVAAAWTRKRARDRAGENPLANVLPEGNGGDGS